MSELEEEAFKSKMLYSFVSLHLVYIEFAQKLNNSKLTIGSVLPKAFNEQHFFQFEGFFVVV